MAPDSVNAAPATWTGGRRGLACAASSTPTPARPRMRPSGRAADACERSPSSLASASTPRLLHGPLRRHPCAVHGSIEERVPRSCAQRARWVTANTACSALDRHPHRARGRARRQAAAPRDPAPDRPQLAGRHPARRLRRAPDQGRLRRHPGDGGTARPPFTGGFVGPPSRLRHLRSSAR